MAFDVGGRIVLQDAFSGTLKKLQTGTKQADDAFENLGDQVDATATSSARRIQQLASQIDALRQKAASGAQITDIDLSNFRAAQSELLTLTGGMDDLAGTTNTTTAAFGGLGKAVIGVGTAFAALRFAQTIIDLTTLGAKAQTVQGIFSNLSENLGVDGAKLQRDLQAAARGTVDSVTLITTANRALLAGGAELAGKIPQLFEIARAASLATGQDINYVFETLVRGIVKASPLLIDNADIYIKIGDAVEQWAASQGKATDELTETERRMAVANAVISQGSEFMRQMGLSAETAADQVQSLPVAIGELKIALGELLVSGGVADAIARLADELGFISDAVTGSSEIRELADQLERLGRPEYADALKEANKALAEQREEVVNTKRRGEEYAEGIKVVDEAQQLLIASTRQLISDLQATDNAELSVVRSFNEAGNAALFQARAITRVSDAVSAFNKAQSDIAAGKTSITAVAGALADLNFQVQEIAANAPDVPELGTLFGTDTRALLDYLDALERINPAQAENIETVRESVREIQAQRTAILEAARASNDKAAALDLLAQAELGAGATAADLAEKMGTLSDAMITAAIDTGTFGELFATAVDQAASKAAGLDGIVAKLKDAAGQFQALTEFTPGTLKTPAIPTDLAFDPAPWYAYLATIEEVGTVQDRLAAGSTRDVIAAFEDQQATILETALSIDDYGARLEYLASALLGAGADVLDLVAKIDQLPPSLAAAVDPTLTLASAIATLRAQAEAPISIGVEVKGFETGLKRIDTLATQLLRGGLSPDKIRQWRTQAVNEYTEAMQDLGDVSQFEWDLTNEVVIGGFQEQVDAAKTATKAISKAYQTEFTGIAQSAGELKGKIESALREGLEVTAEDLALAEVGQYEDKALEAAKRLAAIAERGFSELEVNPDWAAALEIPPNILAGTEAELKAWARSVQKDVEDLTRPDLIDWDAFVREFEEQLNRETAQGITIDMAVDKLNAAGILSGSAEERKKKVAEFLGLDLPELTIETLFETSSTAAGDLRQSLYGEGKKAFEIPSVFVPAETKEDILKKIGLDQPLEAGLTIGELPSVVLDTILQATSVNTDALGTPKIEVELDSDQPITYDKPQPIPVEFDEPDEITVKAKLEATSVDVKLPETPTVKVNLDSDQPITYDKPQPIPVEFDEPDEVPVKAKLEATSVDVTLPETPEIGVNLKAQAITEYPEAAPIPVTLDLPDSVDVTANLIATQIGINLPETPTIEVILKALTPIEYTTPDPILVELDPTQTTTEFLAEWLGGVDTLTIPAVLDIALPPSVDVRLKSEDPIEYTPLDPIPVTLDPAQTPTELLAEWLGAETLSIPATISIITPTAEQAFTPGEDVTTATALVNVPVQVDTSTLDAQARDAADTLANTFVLASAEEQVGLRVASAWSADFAANALIFEGIGKSAGSTMAGAFVEAVVQGIGNVRQRMAELIAPEVAGILNVPKGALP